MLISLFVSKFKKDFFTYNIKLSEHPQTFTGWQLNSKDEAVAFRELNPMQLKHCRLMLKVCFFRKKNNLFRQSTNQNKINV